LLAASVKAIDFQSAQDDFRIQNAGGYAENYCLPRAGGVTMCFISSGNR
jgi:hypothetical protein